MATRTPAEAFGTSSQNEAKIRLKKNLVLFILILLLVGLGSFVWKRYFTKGTAAPTIAAPVEIKLPDVSASPAPVSVPASSESDAPYRSENFRVGEIAIGGETGLFVPESDPVPLAVDSVRGEAFTEKGKSNAKLVITWDTNKPAISKISYGKGVGTAEGVISENNYGTSHSVVIPDLAPASTYVYVISATDKWGNLEESDPYAVYTGARDVSLFELIAGAVGDVFGWAVNK